MQNAYVHLWSECRVSCIVWGRGKRRSENNHETRASPKVCVTNRVVTLAIDNAAKRQGCILFSAGVPSIRKLRIVIVFFLVPPPSPLPFERPPRISPIVFATGLRRPAFRAVTRDNRIGRFLRLKTNFVTVIGGEGKSFRRIFFLVKNCAHNVFSSNKTQLHDLSTTAPRTAFEKRKFIFVFHLDIDLQLVRNIASPRLPLRLINPVECTFVLCSRLNVISVCRFHLAITKYFFINDLCCDKIRSSTFFHNSSSRERNKFYTRCGPFLTFRFGSFRSQAYVLRYRRTRFKRIYIFPNKSHPESNKYRAKKKEKQVFCKRLT